MKTLFLSHSPHEVHLEFAKSIGAEIKITNLNWFVKLHKKISFVGYFYPFISLLSSLFINIKEDILLVDGGSSLYLATFLKLRNPKIRIIYLDGDMAFYKYNINKSSAKKLQRFFFQKIDAVISISEKNKTNISRNTDVPIEIVNPYPKQIKKIKIKRKNYGLYIGRLDPDKNIKRIVQFGMQCLYFEKFIIIGEGAEKNYIKEIAKKNKKIVYLGYRNDIDKFYSQCKFFIHIPDYEPFGCTPLESALCGCFPIISKEVGVSYLFDKTFIVENPENFEEINHKIKYILNNEKKVRNLLKKSIKKIPTKEQAVKNFRNSFNKIIQKIK